MNTSSHNASEALQQSLAMLPHQPPFRFLTALNVLESGVTGEGEWRVSGVEDFFRGHFPGAPLVPGVLIAEAMAQLSGLVWFAPAEIGAARLAQVNVKVLSPVEPPATISLTARLTKHLGELAMFDVAAHVQRDAERIAVATGSVVLVRTGGSM
jgi:3-hydroxyacyl-[acyl-carrier-protein] dehydratase